MRNIKHFIVGKAKHNLCQQGYMSWSNIKKYRFLTQHTEFRIVNTLIPYNTPRHRFFMFISQSFWQNSWQ